MTLNLASEQYTRLQWDQLPNPFFASILYPSYCFIFLCFISPDKSQHRMKRVDILMRILLAISILHLFLRAWKPFISTYVRYRRPMKVRQSNIGIENEKTQTCMDRSSGGFPSQLNIRGNHRYRRLKRAWLCSVDDHGDRINFHTHHGDQHRVRVQEWRRQCESPIDRHDPDSGAVGDRPVYLQQKPGHFA